MPYSSRNSVKTYYEVSGEGFPLVLVHANPFDRRMFIYQVAHFSTLFKVINIDLRGYGYSDKPAIPITMTDLCDDVVAVCRQEGMREALFLGVSVGGVMGLQLGLDHPEIFKALILVGCSSMPGDRYQSRIDGLAAYSQNFENLKLDGAPVDWVPLDPVYGNLNPMGLSAKAPHPSAGKLFVDFVLSKAGQETIREQRRVPDRVDVLPDPPKLAQGFTAIFTADEVYANFDRYVKLFQEIFDRS